MWKARSDKQKEQQASQHSIHLHAYHLHAYLRTHTHRGSNIEWKSVITKVTDKLRMRRNPHVCYTCKVFFGLWKGSCFPCQLGNETCVTESLALFQDFAVCGVLDMLDQFSINITNKLPNHPFSLLAQFCLLGWSQSSNQSGGDPINSSDYRGISFTFCGDILFTLTMLLQHILTKLWSSWYKFTLTSYVQPGIHKMAVHCFQNVFLARYTMESNKSLCGKCKIYWTFHTPSSASDKVWLPLW